MVNSFRAAALLALITVPMTGLPGTADAGGRYREPYVERRGGPEGRGCYWMRQRLYCARYCYVEVDGRRYCRERARWAYPQAPYYEDDYAPHRPVK